MTTVFGKPDLTMLIFGDRACHLLPESMIMCRHLYVGEFVDYHVVDHWNRQGHYGPMKIEPMSFAARAPPHPEITDNN